MTAPKKKPTEPAAKAPAKSTVSYAINAEREISRSEDGLSTTLCLLLEDGGLEYVDSDARKKHPGVMQFLTDESIPFNSNHVTIAQTEGAAESIDENSPEYHLTIPRPPKKTLSQGDKTPAFVEWLKKFKPNTYRQLFGIIGPGVVTKYRDGLDPLTGRPIKVAYEIDAILAHRKNHLTEKPEAANVTDESEDKNVYKDDL